MSANEEDAPEKPPRRIQRSAAALAGALVGVRLGPGGVLVGAVASPYLEDLARRAWDEFRPDSQRRQAEMLGATAEATGLDPEELAGLISKSEHARLLTATAMVGAAGTAWPPKVFALGKALADGLIPDDDQINIADLVVPAMTDMDRVHVSVLELFVRWMPAGTGSPMVVASNGPDGQWDAGWRIWSAEQIIQARPTLRLSGIPEVLLVTGRQPGAGPGGGGVEYLAG